LSLVTLPTGGQIAYAMADVVVNGVRFTANGGITRVSVLVSPGVWADRGLFSYDADPGQVTHAARSAIASSLQDDVSLSYALCTDAPSTTIATFPAGAKTIQSIPIAGVQRVTSIVATAGSGARGEPTSLSLVWNPDLTLASVTAGAVTTAYGSYDAKGNPRTIVEGAGTPAARTTQVTYHPVLATVMTASRTSVDGTTQHVITADYDADGDSAYNAHPTNFVHTLIDQGKTDTTLSGNASTALTLITQYRYDALNRPIQLVYPDGKSVAFGYFASTADPSMAYRLASRSVGAITDQVLAYDADGRVLARQDARGVTTTIAYDELGHIVQTAVGSSIDRYTYDLAGAQTAHIAPSGRRAVNEYDAAERLWRVHGEASDGSVVSSAVAALDDHGDALAVREFAGLGSTASPTCAAGETATFCEAFTYDAFHRRASLTTLSSTDAPCSGNDCRVTYSYDANGNPACVSEAGLDTTCYQRDGRGRLTAVVLPTGTRTTFGYDINDHLISRRDPRALLSTFVWDDFGREISRTTPDSGRMAMNYNTAGLRTSTLDARGIRIDASYDAAGRPIAYTVPSDPSGNQNVQYVYDETGAVPGSDQSYAFSKGRLTTVVSHAADGTRIASHRSYDSRGRVVEQVEERGGEIVEQRYAFGPDGELLSQTYPGGKVVSYQYGARLQPTSATVPFGTGTRTLFDTATYDPDGRLGSLHYANGDIRVATRNKRGELVRLFAGPLLDPYVDERFDYDANGLGRVVAIHHFAGTYDAYDWTMTSDALGRMTGWTNNVTGTVHSASFAYDDDGNRTSETRDGAVTTYGYSDGTNRLAAFSGARTDSWSYDGSGFVTSHTAPGKQVSYTYDAQSRLVQLQDERSAPGPGGLPASITFTYLATSCGGANIAFSINGTLAATAAADAGCTCSPGVRSIVVTDPAILGLVGNGANTFTVSFPQYLAWAVATVNGNDFVIYDAGRPGDALARNPDLCGGGNTYNAGPQTLVQPSLGSVTFSWLATSCTGAQPIAFSINGAQVYSTTANASCTCSPGVATFKTSDAAVLGRLHAGVNTLSVSFPGYMDWAVATVEGQGDVNIYDPSGHAASRDPNLCSPGYGVNINTSANSPAYAPHAKVTFTYDGYGRIWERRMANGRYSRRYYDSSGRLSELKDYRGETVNGDAKYYLTDYVRAGGGLVAQVVRSCQRTGFGLPYACTDADILSITENHQGISSISSVVQGGPVWSVGTDPRGNWTNLGSLRGLDGKDTTPDDIAMQYANLTGNDLESNDPFDGLITGIGHGSIFSQSVSERLGGPWLDGFDGSSYTTNQITDSLGLLGSVSVSAKGNGPPARHDYWSLISEDEDGGTDSGGHDGGGTDGGGQSSPGDTSGQPTAGDTKPADAPLNDTPKDGGVPLPTDTSPSYLTDTKPLDKPDAGLNPQFSDAAKYWFGVVTDVHTTTMKTQDTKNPSPGDSNYNPKNPSQLCADYADGDGCGSDAPNVASGSIGAPRVSGDWISHPINPTDADQNGPLTIPPDRPGYIDPVAPDEMPYGGIDIMHTDPGTAACASSTLACGDK
jgi:YD repeat-containing protein